jgi:hypothetical protein
MSVAFAEYAEGLVCVWLSGKDNYWLTLRSQTGGAITVSWFNESMPQVKDYFTNINNPTPEELTLFELEFGKEVLDFVFSSNKKLEIMCL